MNQNEIKVAKELAEGGDYDQAEKLFYFYLDRAKDIKEATRWARIAAKGNNPKYKATLANMLLMSGGMQECKEAKSLAIDAMKAGYLDASFIISRANKKCPE